MIPFGAGSATDVIPRIVFERMAAPARPADRGREPRRGGRHHRRGRGREGEARRLHAAGEFLRAYHRAVDLPQSAATIPPNDFAAVGSMGNVPNVLIISPSKGIKTLSDFVAKAKAKPGSFNFASVGVGSAVHLSAERFRVSAGYEAVHVPFKGGAEALDRGDRRPRRLLLLSDRDGAAAHQGRPPAGARGVSRRRVPPRCPTFRRRSSPAFRIPTIRSGSAPSRRPAPRPRSCSGSIAKCRWR